MQLYWAIHHLALTKIFGFQLFFLVLSLPIFSLFTAAPNRPCGAYWSRSKLNTTQHQLVFSDRFLGCQLLSGPRNSFPETIKTCILHSDILPHWATPASATFQQFVVFPWNYFRNKIRWIFEAKIFRQSTFDFEMTWILFRRVNISGKIFNTIKY